jgi:hypothetical protein
VCISIDPGVRDKDKRCICTFVAELQLPLVTSSVSSRHREGSTADKSEARDQSSSHNFSVVDSTPSCISIPNVWNVLFLIKCSTHECPSSGDLPFLFIYAGGFNQVTHRHDAPRSYSCLICLCHI